MKIVFDIVSMDASNGDMVFNNEFVEKDFESISEEFFDFRDMWGEERRRNNSLSVAIVNFFERSKWSRIFDECDRSSGFSAFYWSNQIKNILSCDVE